MSYEKQLEKGPKKQSHFGFSPGKPAHSISIPASLQPSPSQQFAAPKPEIKMPSSDSPAPKKDVTPAPKQWKTDTSSGSPDYTKLLSEPDFEENSQYRSTANGKKARRSHQSPLYVQTGFDDILYDYINQDPLAQRRQLTNDITLNTRHDKWKDLPKDVIKIFNYLYATQTPEQAYEYMDLEPWKLPVESPPSDADGQTPSQGQSKKGFLRRDTAQRRQAEAQAELEQSLEYWRLSTLDVSAVQKELEALQQTASELEEQYRALPVGMPAGSGGVSTFSNKKTAVGRQRERIKERQKEVAAQIAALEGDIEKAQDLARWQDYLALSAAPDFEEKSQYRSTANNSKPKFGFIRDISGVPSMIYTEMGFNDAVYDYINRNPDAQGHTMVNSTNTGLSFYGLDESFLKEMTDQEIAIFNYLYAKGKDDPDHQEAYDFVRFLTKDLNRRQRQAAEAMWAEQAREDPAGSSVFSILGSPLKGLSYLGQAADYLADGEIDPNAGYNKFSYSSSAIRDQVAGDIEADVGGLMGKVGSFAYRAGMDMGDVLFTTAVTGGDAALSLAILSTGSAADTTLALKDAGLDDDRALFLGTVAGASEIIAEKVNLGLLMDQASLGKRSFRGFIGGVLTEGSKKVESDLITWTADWLYDCITQEENGEWSHMIQSNMERGMSESEAIRAACADRLLTMGQDLLRGSIASAPGQAWSSYGP